MTATMVASIEATLQATRSRAWWREITPIVQITFPHVCPGFDCALCRFVLKRHVAEGRISERWARFALETT